MIASWQNAWVRKVLLQILGSMPSRYDGVYEFLGESFCEDRFGMVRTAQGKKDVDGHIGDLAVQVKFKWHYSKNKDDRYVTIKPDADYDLLIVCIDGQKGDVELFGAWEKKHVEAARKKSTPPNEVKLKYLKQFACYPLL